MTAIAEFTLSAADFPLGVVFEKYPEATLELDRVVPVGDTVMPYFWVLDPEEDLVGVQGTFEALSELRAVVLMEDLGDRGLFRAEWKPEYMGIMSAIASAGVTVLAAEGSSDGWSFELRADSAERFSTFQERCDELGVPVSLVRLSRLTGMPDADDFGLTSEQREALLLAYESGYFRTPREASLAEMSDELDITGQSLGARLRRGTHRLVGNALAKGTDST